MPGKHILFISSWYPNRNNPAHGIFNRHFVAAAALHNTVSVLHVCSDPAVKGKPELVEFFDNGIYSLFVYYRKSTLKLPLISSAGKIYRYMTAYLKGYRKLLKVRGKPDLIHLNVILPAGIPVFFLHLRYRIPYVVNEGWTGYAPEDGRYKGTMMKILTRKIARSAFAVMPVTAYLEKLMLSHGIRGNYKIIPNVVNTSVFIPTETMNKDFFRFIHVSTLDEHQKNVSGIIRAFQQVLKVSRNVLLVIVGNGPDKTYLQNLVKESGLTGQVQFLGSLPQDALVKEIQQSDGMVVFSNYETFCLVVAEAFACGKPVIASNVGGIASYMTNQFGIMVEKGNESMLTDAMIKMADKKVSFDALKIREFAVANFSEPVVANKLQEVYNLIT